MRIGDAARIIGVPTHVLRHWEEVGAVIPKRLPNGHREYDAQSVAEARLLRLCQSAGMSLAEITILSRTTGTARAALVASYRERLETQISSLEATKAFLDHVLECTHSAVNSCPSCAAHAYPDAQRV